MSGPRYPWTQVTWAAAARRRTYVRADGRTVARYDWQHWLLVRARRVQRAWRVLRGR